MGEGAYGAGKLPDADDRTNVARHALDVPADFGKPQRQLQSERHRLGMNAVSPPDHRRLPVLERASRDRFRQRFEILQNQVAGLAHLQRLRRVDHVGGRQPEVQPTRRRSDGLGHRGREGDDVVLRGLARSRRSRAISNRARSRIVARRIRAERSRRRPSPPAAAVSTSSHVSNRRWSLQIRPISGWVYRAIMKRLNLETQSRGLR